MAELDVVIKGINCHIKKDCRENACPYACVYACEFVLLNDALELLKEQEEKMEHLNNITLEYEKEVFRLQTLLKDQEAVEPTLIREGRNKNYNDYVCPRCDNEVVYEQNYCSECGVRFLWEGR